MKVEIRINPTATADLLEIRNYLEEENSALAVKFVNDILKKIENLILFPEMGTKLEDKIKLKVNFRYLKHGQYLIFYTYRNNIVSIQRVLHARRDYMLLLED